LNKDGTVEFQDFDFINEKFGITDEEAKKLSNSPKKQTKMEEFK